MTLEALGSMFAATVVLLIGTVLNRRVPFLAKYNIPDPITGGLLFAIVASVVAALGAPSLEIDQTHKSLLLLLFFAGVGLSADLRKLRRGGKALAIFLVLLFPYILVQDAVGIAAASALDLHPIYGLVAGSITLVGGHGTGAAYAERFADVNNLQTVMEITMALATFGLVIGGLIGSPIAQYLIKRYNLRPEGSAAAVDPTTDATPVNPIAVTGVIASLAGILAAVLAGRWMEARFALGAITVPGFLWCMMAGIAIRNLLPLVGLRFDDRATDLIATLSLSLFLVITMMALDLVEVARSVGPFLVIIVIQVLFIVPYVIYVCFRFMGRDYEAAVTSAAFIGFNMGSTATAMANMQAITARYGPAPQSFLIAPLAGAFFIDIMNAFVITFLLTLPFLGS